MSEEATHRPSGPTAAAMSVWLQQLNRAHLHDAGWITVNKHYHDMARTTRPFIHEHFSEEEREAAFDGFTLALLTLAHFEDITGLATLFERPSKNPPPSSKEFTN